MTDTQPLADDLEKIDNPLVRERWRRALVEDGEIEP